MMKRLLLLLLVAVPMFGADFNVSLSRSSAEGTWLPNRLAVGETLIYDIDWIVGFQEFAPSDVILEVDVPGVITSVSSGNLTSCTNSNPVRCTFLSEVLSGDLRVAIRVDTPGIYSTTARVIHTKGPDSNPANDVRTHEFQAVALPTVRLFKNGFLPHRLDPGQRGTFSLIAQNRGATPATNVVVTMTLTSGGTFESASHPSCVVGATTVVCTLGSLGQDQTFTVDAVVAAPHRTTGEDLVFEAKVTLAEENVAPVNTEVYHVTFMPRQFVVENVEDQGTGSLRQAIHDLNTLCALNEPCEIAFRIPAPVPASGTFTIQPRTPLPEIVGNFIVDGRTQTTFTGDTNKNGPEIEIDGAFVVEKSGLRIRPACSATVRNVAVNGFPGYGIEAQQVEAGTIGHCSAAQVLAIAEVLENHLARNQRGVGFFNIHNRIDSNVIRNNRRSGIYATNFLRAEIRRNTIEENGAGMFLHVAPSMFGPPAGADVFENVIARNNGMAIARTRNGAMEITNNSIFDNLMQGIDIGVDAITPNRPMDADAPNHPVLRSATYDPVRNETIVRGRLDSDAVAGKFTASYVIEVYASSRLSVWAYPQAESRVAEVRLHDGHEDFEIVAPGDLRGKWITATSTAFHFVGFARTPGAENHRNDLPGNTSELSNAVMVQ